MRHRVKARKLNRTSSHHKAMQRNLAQSLFQHGRITTTLEKAKDVRPFVERLITLARSARQGSITARRQIHKLMSDRSLIPAERQSDYDDMSLAKRDKVLRARSGRRYRTGMPKGKLPFTGETITHRLLTTVAEKFEGRPGGFTRLIRLGRRRLGDGGELAMLQLVGDEESPGSLTKPERSARKVRADARYALAIKLAKQRRGGKAEGGKGGVATAEAPAGDASADHTPADDADKSAE
ncbi:MAG TPA: 50S ribosomal protein L17 [Phycisphaerae bacterium]|nr:50S ribosomal protein L17 [Phycisphaerales bacterium]HRX86773.1 50S ribosomal protein L17 [Phycisphaerae bacterium]